MSEPRGPTRTQRIAIAFVVAVAAAAYVLVFYSRQSPLAVSDFDAIWTAGQALRSGHDPYGAIVSPPWPWDLQYPLPAVLVALPFTLLSLEVARAAFMAMGTALLAYGLTRRAFWPLIVLASGQFFFALQSVQWTPLFAAGLLLPGLQVLWSVKPTTGLALFAAYPNRRTVIGGLLFLMAAFAAWPPWIEGWLVAASRAPHGPSILKPGGFILLLALLRWRLPEARQLAVLACLPTSPHLYEGLPLLLAARSRREILLLAVCGGLGLAAGVLAPPSIGPDHGPIPWAIMFLSAYLPALVVVLRHRNVAAPGARPLEAFPPPVTVPEPSQSTPTDTPHRAPL
jgi:hypothetical protein